MTYLRTKLLAASSLLGVALSPAMVGSAAAQGLIEDPKDWRLSIGAGVLVGPEYVGSDETEVTPVPFIDYRYQDWFFASTSEGIGVQYPATPNLKLGARLSPDFGREEDDGEILEGMGDIDPTVLGGVFADFGAGYWNVRASIDGDIIGEGHDGVTGTLDLSWGTRFDNGGTFKVTTGITMMDEDYAQAFFGVTPEQSAASGNEVADPGAGMRDVHFGISGTYPLLDRVTAIASLTFTNLNGDAQEGPITEEDSYVTGVFGVAYTF